MSQLGQVWRSLPYFTGPGRLHMALDGWLLEQHRQGRCPPTLRFYGWEPRALSLGYHQRRFPAEWRTLTWQGASIDLVRRPSGGRAVLHHGELTYALVASGFAASRMQAYQDICAFLIRGWRSLGVELAFGTAGQGYIHNPNCFGTATAADLVTPEGYKLIGSAQLRRGTSLLQHGSMRLQPEVGLMQKIFGLGHSATPPAPPPHPVTRLSLESIQAALKQAAAQQFGVTIEEMPLSAAEWAEVRSLADDPNFLALA